MRILAVECQYEDMSAMRVVACTRCGNVMYYVCDWGRHWCSKFCLLYIDDVIVLFIL